MNQNAVNQANMNVSLNSVQADDLANIAESATIAFAAGTQYVCGITITILNAYGVAIKKPVDIVVFRSTNADGTTIVDSSTTGLAVVTGELMATLKAKAILMVRTAATGIITMTDTDTSPALDYIGVVLPNGKIVMSRVLAATDFGS